MHAGVDTGFYIAFGITNVDALPGFSAGQFTGMQHGRRVRFALVQCVATDNGRGTVIQAQVFQERVCQPAGLVGDNPPADTAFTKHVKYVRDAGKWPGQPGDILPVGFQQALSQWFEGRV